MSVLGQRFAQRGSAAAWLLLAACGDAAAGSSHDSDAAAQETRAEVVEGTQAPAATRAARKPNTKPAPSNADPAEAADVDAGPTLPGSERAPAAADGPEILTQRYDNARTGANLDERVLRPDNVSDLKLLGGWRVDAEIYAQVLVAAGVEVDGTKLALAIVATMNNTLYAFDVDAPPADAFVWQQGLHGELGTPAFCARNIAGPNGILSTPVIDKARGHVYVVARDCDPAFPPEAPSCKHRLSQIALASGEVLQTVAIEGEVSLAADGGGEPRVAFDPSAHWNRPGLALQGDTLLVSFGSGPAGNQHEEDFVYHGWAFRFSVTDLHRQPEVFCTTPRGRGGSIWQSGAAPAADDSGFYLAGANGIAADSKVHPPENWPTTPVDHEDSVVRLSHDASVKAYWDDRDYIQQGNVFQHMESGDNGFGSSGPLLIPDTRLLLIGSKAGLVYLIDRESMKAVQEPLSPFTDLMLQPGHTLYLHSWWGIPMITQTFVFFRPDAQQVGYAYAWAGNDRLRQLRFDYDSGQLELSGTADVPDVLGGGNMVLSAAGSAADSGVLWATTRTGDGTGGPEGVLWAFDPRSLEVLYQTQTPAWAKFNPPTVIRGRVLVPSTAPNAGINQQVLVYGLRH